LTRPGSGKVDRPFPVHAKPIKSEQADCGGGGGGVGDEMDYYYYYCVGCYSDREPTPFVLSRSSTDAGNEKIKSATSNLLDRVRTPSRNCSAVSGTSPLLINGEQNGSAGSGFMEPSSPQTSPFRFVFDDEPNHPGMVPFNRTTPYLNPFKSGTLSIDERRCEQQVYSSHLSTDPLDLANSDASRDLASGHIFSGFPTRANNKYKRAHPYESTDVNCSNPFSLPILDVTRSAVCQTGNSDYPQTYLNGASGQCCSPTSEPSPNSRTNWRSQGRWAKFFLRLMCVFCIFLRGL
uniref:Uncharacterized protein n=1 Tax=Echinostoma caproni TaxID=27848 RepID=A0A183B7L1_9TREM